MVQAEKIQYFSQARAFQKHTGVPIPCDNGERIFFGKDFHGFLSPARIHGALFIQCCEKFANPFSVFQCSSGNLRIRTGLEKQFFLEHEERLRGFWIRTAQHGLQKKKHLKMLRMVFNQGHGRI
jgi:hypothetical protein